MSKNRSSSAAGPLAGYLFQPERALLHLATCPLDSQVGIETLDDVSVLTADGHQIREQDKHSINNAGMLKNKEFWKTLNIWLDAIENEEVVIEKTNFLLVTNQKLDRGLAYDLMSLTDKDSARSAFLTKLRSTGKRPPEGLKEIVAKVLSHTDKRIETLLSRVQVIDATSASSADDLRTIVSDKLHLPEAHRDEILNALSGWIVDTTLQLLREGKPAWITRSAFDEQFRRQLYLYQDIRFIKETEEALIEVTEEARAAQRSELFVLQLTWVHVKDGEEVLEAIDDYVRCGAEATRLTKMGVVQPADFRAFEDRLVRRWTTLRRIHVPSPCPTSTDELIQIGYDLLQATMNHREPLAGQATNEYYLTRGGYHRLANEPRLGWHPSYEKKFAALSKTE